MHMHFYFSSIEVREREQTPLCHIEVLKIDYCTIPVSQHVPSAAPRRVAPLCGPLQQGQQQQNVLSYIQNVTNINTVCVQY